MIADEDLITLGLLGFGWLLMVALGTKVSMAFHILGVFIGLFFAVTIYNVLGATTESLVLACIFGGTALMLAFMLPGGGGD